MFHLGISLYLVIAVVVFALLIFVIKSTMASASSESSEESSKPTLTMQLLMSGIRKKFPLVKHISTSEVQSKMETNKLSETPSNIVLLDVRYKDEFDVSCLPEATWIDENLTPEEKLSIVEMMLSKKQATEVFVYCSVGYRSSDLISRVMKSSLHEKFIEQNINFYNISGGMFQWANEKRQFVDKNGTKADLVHPYNAFFGKLLNKCYRFKPEKSL